MRFAPRMDDVLPSGVREFFDLARRLPGAIDLSIGQVDFEVPDGVKAAAIEAIGAPGCGRYTPTEGEPALAEAITAHVRAAHGAGDGEVAIVTSGATGAIVTAMLALVGPGDEVLLPDPGFIVYGAAVRIAGGAPVFYDLYPDFQLDLDDIERRMTPRTRLLVLNNPANPTGASFAAADVDALARLCRARGVFVLSDELYAQFTYDAPHAGLKPLLGDGCLLVGGPSKSHGMAGWRLGWAVGPAALVDRMRTLQQFLYACPPTPLQQGALAALGCDMSAVVDRYRDKRDRAWTTLVEAGYDVQRPGGSYYLFPKVPWGSDRSFCEAALTEKLVLVPGSTFSRRDTHFRLSFAAPEETLERGLEALTRLARVTARS